MDEPRMDLHSKFCFAVIADYIPFKLLFRTCSIGSWQSNSIRVDRLHWNANPKPGPLGLRVIMGRYGAAVGDDDLPNDRES